MNYSFLSFEEQSALLSWHKWLDNNRGDRARLRRADCAEDILLTDAFFHFLQHMPDSWLDKKQMMPSAAVAGLLSHVKEDKRIDSKGYQPKDKSKQRNIASFAELLARPVKGDRAPVSELRFQQLQQSRTTDEFYRRMLRAIRLLGCRGNIVSLANDTLHWHQEFEQYSDQAPSHRLAVLWATDYFTAFPKKSN